MDREDFEREALAVVQGEVTAALPELAARGLAMGALDLSRRGEDEGYESEVRIYAYRDGQLCDALEVHVWRDGGPVVSMDELRSWFRAQLQSVG